MNPKPLQRFLAILYYSPFWPKSRESLQRHMQLEKEELRKTSYSLPLHFLSLVNDTTREKETCVLNQVQRSLVRITFERS